MVYLAYFVADILDLLRFCTRETMGVCVRGRKLYGGWFQGAKGLKSEKDENSKLKKQ